MGLGKKKGGAVFAKKRKPTGLGRALQGRVVRGRETKNLVYQRRRPRRKRLAKKRGGIYFGQKT